MFRDLNKNNNYYYNLNNYNYSNNYYNYNYSSVIFDTCKIRE